MQTELRSDLAPGAVLSVQLTAGSAEEAARIGRMLVEERLAACVHRPAPHTAIYQWDGRMAEEAEHSLLAKTTAARLPDLVARVRQVHSHAIPGLVAWPVAGGDRAFLDWVRAEVAPRPQPGA